MPVLSTSKSRCESRWTRSAPGKPTGGTGGMAPLMCASVTCMNERGPWGVVTTGAVSRALYAPDTSPVPGRCQVVDAAGPLSGVAGIELARAGGDDEGVLLRRQRTIVVRRECADRVVCPVEVEHVPIAGA